MNEKQPGKKTHLRIEHVGEGLGKKGKDEKPPEPPPKEQLPPGPEESPVEVTEITLENYEDFLMPENPLEQRLKILYFVAEQAKTKMEQLKILGYLSQLEPDEEKRAKFQEKLRQGLLS